MTNNVFLPNKLKHTYSMHPNTGGNKIVEVPNKKTARQMAVFRNHIEKGNYYKFDTSEQAIDFLKKAIN